jgi:hypothetical protein
MSRFEHIAPYYEFLFPATIVRALRRATRPTSSHHFQ